METSVNGSAKHYGARPDTRLILITPARNERKYIEATLESVSRTNLPPDAMGDPVSDGSTDGTDDIVTAYTRQFDWIQLLDCLSIATAASLQRSTASTPVLPE